MDSTELNSDFIKRMHPVTAAITDLLEQHKVLPADGETLLAYLAGMSAGLRQSSITGNIIQSIAIGYILATKEEPGE